MTIEEIIIKECSNQTLTRTEKETLEKWLEENPRNRMVYAQMKLALLQRGEASIKQAKGEVWKRVKSRMQDSSHYIKAPTRTMTHLLRVAAIILLCAGLGMAVYHFQSENEMEPVSLTMIEKVSLPGQKVNTTLPDGTIVKLNAGSKIIVPATFAAHSREVELEGEAFFDVQRDTVRPFIITTGDLRVKVLGTSFNVRAYPGESFSTVAVATGRVIVSDTSDASVHLVRGDKVGYSKASRSMSKGQFNEELEFGWKDNLLIFEANDFREISHRLELWYGVEILIRKSDFPKDKKFSGRYENPTLRAVLEGLSYVYGFNYDISNNTVTLK